jgi:hypothetical protein
MLKPFKDLKSNGKLLDYEALFAQFHLEIRPEAIKDQIRALD